MVYGRSNTSAGGGGAIKAKGVCWLVLPSVPKCVLWAGAMKQRILRDQMPPCHKRPVTAHEYSAALQHRSCSYLFFVVHPPVLSTAPSGERNHGNATVHNGCTCWSVWGV